MVVCLALTGVVGAQAADRDFDAIVHRLEAHYGKKRTHIPLLGMANLFVKVSQPEGVKSLELAVFEDLAPDLQPSPQALDTIFESLPDKGWKPFVRVRSNRDGEHVQVYSRLDGKTWQLLVATVERTEATVMKLRLSPEALAQWIDDPESMAAKKDH
jgi:hypothetical protein